MHSSIIDQMLKGYGSKFSKDKLFGIKPTEYDLKKLDAFIPAISRYLKERGISGGSDFAKDCFANQVLCPQKIPVCFSR